MPTDLVAWKATYTGRRKASRAAHSKAIEHFERTGKCEITEKIELLPTIINYCEFTRTPYTLDALPFERYRIVRKNGS